MHIIAHDVSKKTDSIEKFPGKTGAERKNF